MSRPPFPMDASPKPWIATYRIQLHKGFPLSAAAEILPYLRDLGISHVYLSPCLQAAPGSTHGYDVADPTRIAAELGGEPAWAAFIAATKAAGLGVLLDIVPNHMATHPANVWWSDVLAHGPFSEHAATFDLFPFAIADRWEVAICTLGEPYGKVLEQGQLTIDLEKKTVTDKFGFSASFDIDETIRHRLLEGLDDIGLTLQNEKEITAYEATHS